MLTYGFYNSYDGDRKYNAEQMSAIFDGIITDGILMNVGDRFEVKAAGGMAITLGSGRAWFDKTWTYNSSPMLIMITPSHPLLNRIDALVLEVDRRDESRMNNVRWLVGEPSTFPQRPTLTKDLYIKQYPLAYVSVPTQAVDIPQANITNMIGTPEAPYVTAPLDKIDTSQLLAQWNSEWSILLNSMNNQQSNQQNSWQIQMNNQQNQWLAQMDILNAKYIEMLNLFYALETGTYVLINNNFDDWSVRRGCDIRTEFLPNGDIIQRIVVLADGFLLAQKLTTFNPDGSILETVTFYPYEMVEDAGAGRTRTILTTGVVITKLTTFNADGTITERIGGSTVVYRLHDSTISPLNDSDNSELYVQG